MIAFEPSLNTFQDVARQWPDSIRDRLDSATTAATAARRAVQTPDAARAYCRHVRESFWRALGGLPSEASAPRDGAHEVHGTLTHLGLRITKLTYESFPGVPVSALLYQPAAAPPPGRKRAAVVFMCGHYSQAKVAAEFQLACLELALNDLVVLCIDPLGQGERYQYAAPGASGQAAPLVPPGTFDHSYSGLQCLLAGRGVSTYFAWDAVRAVDLLSSLPDVDPTRIGATGNSGGGAQTVFLMLADDRLAAAMPCTYITSLSAFYRTGQPLDAEMNQAGTLALGIDHADQLLGFAPKPLLVGAAAFDFFPIEGTEESVAEARRLYALLSAEDKLSLTISPSPHLYSPHLREAAVRFFTRSLDGEERYQPRTAEDIPTLPESDLLCSPTGQLYRDRPGSRSVFHLTRDFLASRRSTPPTTPEDVAARLSRALGPMPALDATPIRPRYFDPKPADGYATQHVFFLTEPGIAVAGTLLRSQSPQPGNAPTWLILLPHGTASPDDALAESIALARAGHTVFIFDPRGRGAVKTVPTTIYAPYDSWLGQEGWMSYVELLSGHTTLASRVYDVRRALSFLEQFEGASSLAIRGHHVAALWGYLAGALDRRLQTAHFTQLLPSWLEIVDTHIFDSDTVTAAMVLPAVLQHLDLPDLRQCYAGRQLTIESPLRVPALPSQLPLKRNAVPTYH